jgi:hypothetical protein
LQFPQTKRFLGAHAAWGKRGLQIALQVLDVDSQTANTPHTRTTCTLAHSDDTTTMVTPGYGNAYASFATSCTAQQQGLIIRFTRRVAYEMFWTSALSTRAPTHM